MEGNTLTVLDWLIIVLYGIGMLIVGFYFSHKNKNTEDYLLGGRQMKSWKVGISLFATMFSAITYLSLPGEMIKYGPMIFATIATLPFVYFVVAYFFIPFIMKLNISSAYELLEKRLGKRNRIIASIYFLTMRILWMSVIIYMVSEKIIIPIMNWSKETSLLVSIIMGVITIIYTSSGGLRGVVLTDVVQSAILFGGSILIIFLIVKNIGGLTNIIPDEYPSNWSGWVFFDTNVRISFMTAFISTFSWFVCTAGSDQMTIQRYLATKDVKAAQKMFLSSILANIFVNILLLILGLSLFAYIKIHPEILGLSSINNIADSILPRFIAFGLPVGFSGLVLAGLMAAAMSSLSSGINSSSLTIIDDFILNLKLKSLSEKRKIRLAQFISLMIGVVIVLLSLVIANIRGNLLELTYRTSNLFVAPLFVPFFMAMFIKKAKSNATFIGTLLSGITAIFISFSKELFNTDISFLWIIPVSLIVGITVSIFLSYYSHILSFEKNK